MDDAGKAGPVEPGQAELTCGLVRDWQWQLMESRYGPMIDEFSMTKLLIGLMGKWVIRWLPPPLCTSRDLNLKQTPGEAFRIDSVPSFGMPFSRLQWALANFQQSGRIKRPFCVKRGAFSSWKPKAPLSLFPHYWMVITGITSIHLRSFLQLGSACMVQDHQFEVWAKASHLVPGKKVAFVASPDSSWK